MCIVVSTTVKIGSSRGVFGRSRHLSSHCVDLASLVQLSHNAIVLPTRQRKLKRGNPSPLCRVFEPTSTTETEMEEIGLKCEPACSTMPATLTSNQHIPRGE